MKWQVKNIISTYYKHTVPPNKTLSYFLPSWDTLQGSLHHSAACMMPEGTRHCKPLSKGSGVSVVSNDMLQWGALRTAPRRTHGPFLQSHLWLDHFWWAPWVQESPLELVCPWVCLWRPLGVSACSGKCFLGSGLGQYHYRAVSPLQKEAPKLSCLAVANSDGSPFFCSDTSNEQLLGSGCDLSYEPAWALNSSQARHDFNFSW